MKSGYVTVALGGVSYSMRPTYGVMRDIDFRPEWYTQSLVERANARYHFSGFMVVAALLVVWSVDATSRSRASESVVTNLEATLQAQEPMIAQLKTLDSRIEKERKDLTLLRDLDGGVPTSAIVSELSHLMPSAMTVRGLLLHRTPRFGQSQAIDAKRMESYPKRTTLEFEGWARSGEEIGNLVSGMSDSPLFENVALDHERPEELNGRSVVAFKIVCHLPDFE